MGYNLQANAKTLEERAGHPDRDRQFHYLNNCMKRHLHEKQPVISVDTKKVVVPQHRDDYLSVDLILALLFAIIATCSLALFSVPAICEYVKKCEFANTMIPKSTISYEITINRDQFTLFSVFII